MWSEREVPSLTVFRFRFLFVLVRPLFYLVDGPRPHPSGRSGRLVRGKIPEDGRDFDLVDRVLRRSTVEVLHP